MGTTSLSPFRGDGRSGGLGPGVERRRIAGPVAAEVGHSDAQALDQMVKEGAEVGQAGRWAHDVEEAREIPVVGNLVGGSDVQQSAQGGGVQFGQGVVAKSVAEGNGPQQNAPPAWPGKVMASLAAGGLESVEERLIRDAVEQVREGGESGIVFQFGPDEEGLCGVDSFPGAVALW